MTPGRPILTLAHAAAEVSWLYPCVVFVTSPLVDRALPFEYGLTAFIAAAIVGYLSLGHGLRNILILVIQAAAFAAAALMCLHAMNFAAVPLFSTDWIVQGFKEPHSQRYWIELVLVCLSILLYWVSGTLLSRRRLIYRTVCARFDIGLAVFFALFLMQMVIEIKGGPRMSGNAGLYSLISFLLFSLLAIGIARSKRSGSRNYLPGYGLIGVFVTFCAVIVLTVGALVIFFLPALEKAAEVGYAVFTKGGGLFGSILVPILRFFLAPHSVRSDPPAAANDMGRAHYTSSTTWYGRLIEDIIMWGSTGIMVIMALIAAGMIIFFLSRWLLRRSGRMGDNKRSGGIRDLLVRLWRAIILLIQDIRQRLKGRKTAHDLYGALKTWGKRSGLPHRLTETPSEFGDRLSRSHPALDVHFEIIVDSFNRETYGNRPVSDRDLSRGRSSLRTLAHPRHWPKRLKTILTGREDVPQMQATIKSGK